MKKSSVITNRTSTTRFPMSSLWTSYVVPNPQRVTQKRKVSKIWTISYDNSETVRLLLITNRKSHTGFRLVPTSMTLNDLDNLAIIRPLSHICIFHCTSKMCRIFTRGVRIILSWEVDSTAFGAGPCCWGPKGRKRKWDFWGGTASSLPTS